MRRTGDSAGSRFSGAAYTWFVRGARVLLPFAALAIVGFVITRLSRDPLEQVASFARETSKTLPGRIELEKAQYEGVDDRGRPYSLAAARAARATGAPDTVLFEELKADLLLEDKSWLAVHAGTGAYDTKGKTLSLGGGVSIFHDSGYELALAAARIDLGSRAASSDGAVLAQGPLGRITARGLEVTNAGARVVFSGPATLTLYRLGG